LFHARAALEAALGAFLEDYITATLAPDRARHLAQNAGGRALVNRMLALGVAADHAPAIAHASQQVMDDNMTLSQGAIAALNNSANPARQTALKAFHDRWRNNPLVLEKWFMMEAMSATQGTVARLDELMRHPAFDPKNPNKLRAVLGAFMSGNPTRFYAADASGFEFIGDCLIDIDRRNGQVAARMALPLTRMAAYGAERQAQMRAVLMKIQRANGSDDLGEVVDKALKA
jgi:aminopeptidase N